MKNNIPKISIVLPCYNGADMLGGAIESVLNQTYKDWELIIVNDCSTDNTLEIANAYAAKDNRIRVFSNEHNSKLPATLNHGFKEARGEYWTWTSDDNLLLPDFCEEMSTYLDEHLEIGFVVGGEQVIDANGNTLGLPKQKPKDIQQQMMLNNFVGACFMYRSEVAKKAGEYRTDLFLVEDYEYWMRLSTMTKMALLEKNLYLYRVHPNSLTATRQKDIQERLCRLRLLYRGETEKQLRNHPKLLRLYYYRIVDHLAGAERWKYYWDFAAKLPIQFGVQYVMVHMPHRIFQKMTGRNIR